MMNRMRHDLPGRLDNAYDFFYFVIVLSENALL